MANYVFSEQEIIDSIKICLKISPQINANSQLVSTVFHILKKQHIENYKYIVLEAPTGSGKTIIGFMIFFCTQYMIAKKLKHDLTSDNGRIESNELIGYYLTSAKILQEQIASDLDRFEFHEWINILKGGANYECTKATLKENCFQSYVDRPCVGTTNDERNDIKGKYYCEHNVTCKYTVARQIASESPCAVLNYAYFLNSFKSEFRKFFDARPLTICDEAHLLPNIVCDLFNYSFDINYISKILKIANQIDIGFGSGSYSENKSAKLKELVMPMFKYFEAPLTNEKDLNEYYDGIQLICETLSYLKKDIALTNVFGKDFNKLIEQGNKILDSYYNFNNLINDRPYDVYSESEILKSKNKDQMTSYRHIIKDLDESQMVRTNFLAYTEKCVFMSATFGDIDEYAQLMGFEKGSYFGMRIKSTFDFDNSPIFLCNSGWLNYNNFDSNIDKVLMDCIKICEQYHPKEKGIIHTSTFKICNLLREKVELISTNKTRYLFYNNAVEKEQHIELMKNSMIPYVLIGPSLYEGIDLKDEQGRFNILVKTPYDSLTPYVKQKSERYPFYYERVVLEKITQAIGRTNRHKNDYSKTYLLDSLFDKLIYKTNEIITDRIQYKKIY